MEVESGLYLQVMVRPVLGSDPAEERLLWYWNPATDMVEVAPNEESLRVISTRLFGEFTLDQVETAPPPELRIAEPRASDLGEHRHVLYYALDDDPNAAIGAYGFFARMTSPAYAPSEPFLIALNHGLGSDAFETGALAINAAAAEPPVAGGDCNLDNLVDIKDTLCATVDTLDDTLAAADLILGDADGDGQVAFPDFVTLSNHFGAPGNYMQGDFDLNGRVEFADFVILSDNFGKTSAATIVAEPSASMLGLICLGAILFSRNRIRHPRGGASDGA
jgi:hypothetical protein